MKITKLFLIAVLLLLLACFGASAQDFFSRPFLTGWSLLVNTNVTITYGDTNIAYADPGNTNQVFSLTNSVIKAVFTSVTATNTVAMNMGGPAGYWTNSINASATNVTWAQAWYDVPLAVDRNGSVQANQAITFAIRGTNSPTGSAPGTNRLTFTFVGVASAGRHIEPRDPIIPSGGVLQGFPGVIAAETTNQSFVVSMIPNGMTLTVMRTNLPLAQLYGCGAIRLQKIVSEAAIYGAASGTFIDAIQLSGFQP